VPWGNWLALAIVLLATFMSWGMIVPVASDQGFPVHLFGAVELTAWNSHAMGIPCWTVLIAAVVLAALRTARWLGVAIPFPAVFVPSGVGLLFSAAMFFGLAFGPENASPGVGSFVSLACFGWWMGTEFAALRAGRPAGLRRRRRRTGSETA
jgi:hypothetical protein